MLIAKRDGTRVPFDKKKIISAVNKAFIEVDGQLYEADTAKSIAEDIEQCSEKHALSVEDIQNLVEEMLMDSERKDVARAYVRYRYKKEVARQKKDDWMKAIRSKLMGENIENSNANVDEASFGGRLGEATNEMTKQLALDEFLSPVARQNHLENMIYTHDLASYVIGQHNCLSCPVDDLLAKGFKTRQVDIRPANSINTAFQLIAVIFQIQSLMQFGGVAATHIDFTMIPYVRKSFFKHYKDGVKYIEERELDYSFHDWLSVDDEDYKVYSPRAYQYALDKTEKELAQAAEGLLHNLNSLQSRSGNQLPFSSINLGTSTETEGRMTTKAILEAFIKGTGPFHRTSIFPCCIFICKEGVNRKPGDPNYDLFQLALRSTAQRLYPNYANDDCTNQKAWVKYDRDNKQAILNKLTKEEREILVKRIAANPSLGYSLSLDIVNNDIQLHMEELPIEQMSTMGCRTQNGADVNAPYSYEQNIYSVIDNGKLYDNVVSAAQKDGRGNICPVTIILPTLAMMAKEQEGDVVENFMVLLDQKIHEAKDQLIERYKWICSQSAASAKFMYENNTMYGYVPEEGIESALRHGTLAIGNIGLAETLRILIGEDQTTPKGMELGCRIYQLYKDRCAEFKEKYKLNFGVYYTPAESLAYTAMMKFQQKYGKIPGISDRDYFTNSVHVSVWKEISPFEKIDIEAKLDEYSSAGCILYIELDSGVKNNIPALETLVNYAMDKGVPYFAINVPVDTCVECGYTDEINDSCPECGGASIERLRRVTGYLTGSFETSFNQGKRAETLDRVRHC